MCAQPLSHVQLFETSGTVAHPVPLSMGFSRQEHWGELPFPPPGGLPNPGIKSISPGAPALAGGLFTIVSPKRSQRKKSTVNQFSFSANLIVGVKECFGFHSL